MKTHTLFTVLVSAAIVPACARHVTPPTAAAVAREAPTQTTEPSGEAPASDSNAKSEDEATKATTQTAIPAAAPPTPDVPPDQPTEATREPATMGVSPW